MRALQSFLRVLSSRRRAGISYGKTVYEHLFHGTNTVGPF